MAKIINGLAIAKEIRQELKDHIIEWEKEGHRAPHLTAVLIGDDPASHTYVNNKIKVGYIFFSLSLLLSLYLFIGKKKIRSDFVFSSHSHDNYVTT